MLGRPILMLIAAIALIAAINYGLWQNGGPGPGLMPAAGACLMIGALLLSFRSKEGSDAVDAQPGSWKSVAILVSGLVLIVPLTAGVGLLATLGVFALLLFVLVDKMPLGRSLAISAGLVAGSWLIFERLLSVPLPKPMFW